ncbi:MAG: hypothetical protein MUC58_13030 [Rhizobiaceae bacterium]|jgi:uncharacterized membrane protein|nr:hypothetical protein [Rhizobiaceae bacterium]
MRKLAYTVLTGLVGAVFLHLAIIFLIPVLAGGRTYAALAPIAGETADALVFAPPRLSGETPSDPAETPLPTVSGNDPFFASRVCAFDLSAGSFRVTSDDAPNFFSVAVLDDRDRVVFSLVDRLALDNRVDLEVLAKAEEGRRRQRQQAGLADPGEALPVFAARDQGLVVVRAFVPDATYAESVDAFLRGITCETIAFGAS